MRAKTRCENCGKKDPIKPGVPFGKWECKTCRENTGYCLICRANRNDCCC